LFRDAVRCRLGDRGTVLAELSGGLDSSSIVCTADDLLRTRSPRRLLRTITYLSPEGADGDERLYVESVERRVEQRGTHLRETYSPFFPEELESTFLDSPAIAVGRTAAVKRVVDEVGAEVVLSGSVGDHIMWGSWRRWPQLADLMSEGRVLDLHRQIKAIGTSWGRTYWDLLWREAIKPHLPVSLIRTGSPPSWIRQPSDEAAAAILDSPRQRYVARRRMSESMRLALEAAFQAVVVCRIHPLRAFGGINVAFPYVDRRLVQFMLAIPFEQRLRSTSTRWLQRSALEGLLPPEVSGRSSKGSGGGFLCRAVNHDWKRLEEMFADPMAADRGYVSKSGVQDALRRAKTGVNLGDGLFILRVIALESWLRNYYERCPAVVRPDPLCQALS
jgi:asparagine synthase (glutamine-hydrolysing)